MSFQLSMRFESHTPFKRAVRTYAIQMATTLACTATASCAVPAKLNHPRLVRPTAALTNRSLLPLSRPASLLGAVSALFGVALMITSPLSVCPPSALLLLMMRPYEHARHTPPSLRRHTLYPRSAAAPPGALSSSSPSRHRQVLSSALWRKWAVQHRFPLSKSKWVSSPRWGLG
ncbi:hypothetical protein NL676_038594 [Syzygium grande]|nr:hypothetical protein NL676_038594 [Syzygium grande]